MTCKDCLHVDVCDGALFDHRDEACSDFADKSQFIEIPYKIGSVVYSSYGRWRKESGIVPYQITNLTITQNKKGKWAKKYRAMWLLDGKTRDRSVNFDFDEIGQTVFLTREDAEAALRKEK